MEIKGNIGEEVYVKGSIKKIVVAEKGIKYSVIIRGVFHEVDSEDVKFLEEPKAEKKAEKKTEKKTETPQPSKKRGRPRKTTVDDLMMKAQRVQDE